MNAWQILAIAPTTDQRAIKRAYAKQLKLIDQEQNPAEFLQLRDAFEQAQYYAQYLSDKDLEEDNLFESNADDIFATSQQPSSSLPEQGNSNVFESHTETASIEQIYQSLEQQIQQHYAQSSIQNTLIELKGALNHLSTEIQNLYLEKIAYLLYINDLEDLFEILEPPKSTSESNLYNIPIFDQTDDIDANQDNISPTDATSDNHTNHDGQSNELPRHQAFGLFNIPVFSDSKEDNPPPLNPTLSLDEIEIEKAYQELSLQLQQNHADVSWHDRLYRVPKLLLKLEKEKQVFFRQKFLDLMTQYGHEKWFFFIFEQQDNHEPSLDSDSLNTKNNFHSEDVSQNINQQDISNISSFEMLPTSPSHTQTLSQRFYWLETQLESHHFGDDVYQHFSQLLDDLQHTNLQQQIDLKANIERTLAYLDFEQYPKQLERFMLLWNQHFPLQNDCLDNDELSDRLKTYLDHYTSKTQIFNDFPDYLHPALHSIFNDESLKPKQIVQLHKYLSRDLKLDSPPSFFSEKNIKNRYSNANLMFLSLFNIQWQSIWWMVWGVITFIYLNNTLPTENPITVIFISIGVFLLTHFIKLICVTKILSQENRNAILKYINITWFLSGLALCAAPILVSTDILSHLYYIWIFYTFILFQTAQYFYPYPIIHFFNAAASTKIDPWIIVIALLSAYIGIESWINDYFSNAGDISNWHYALMLIPIGFLLFNDFFKSLYQSFGYRLDSEPESNFEYNTLSKSQIFANSIFLLFRCSLVFVPIYLFIENPIYQSHLYLSGIIFCSIFLLSFSRFISYYLIKYVSYIYLIIGSYLIQINLLVITFFIFLVYSLFKDIKYKSSSTN